MLLPFTSVLLGRAHFEFFLGERGKAVNQKMAVVAPVDFFLLSAQGYSSGHCQETLVKSWLLRRP